MQGSKLTVAEVIEWLHLLDLPEAAENLSQSLEVIADDLRDVAKRSDWGRRARLLLRHANVLDALAVRCVEHETGKGVVS